MSSRTPALLALSLLTVVALSACGSAADSPQQFRSVSSDPDGRVMALAGDSTGHEAGATSTFVVTVQNGSNDPWRDGYCILLVDGRAIVSNLAQTTFALTPEQGERHTITVTLPAGVPDGAYGLTLLIPGVSSVTSPITVGDAPDATAGEVSAPIGTGCATGVMPDADFRIGRDPFMGELTPQGA